MVESFYRQFEAEFLRHPSRPFVPGVEIAGISQAVAPHHFIGRIGLRQMMEMAAPEMARFSSNVSKILAREFFSAWRKMTVMNAPTIEAKIQMYLTELDNETGKTGVVKVPFDRERMAEYFGVTRPALSRSLGHLRDRGLISWRKNEFRINF